MTIKPLDGLPINYDERLELPEPEMLDYCPYCEQPIYQGEEIVWCEKGYIHKECFIEWTEEELIYQSGLADEILGGKNERTINWNQGRNSSGKRRTH